MLGYRFSNRSKGGSFLGFRDFLPLSINNVICHADSINASQQAYVQKNGSSPMYSAGFMLIMKSGTTSTSCATIATINNIVFFICTPSFNHPISNGLQNYYNA
jgi:hypothetical protein